MQERTDLVAIAPKEVLGADVLVGVLGLLLHGRLVGFVLPVSVPPHLTIDSSHEQAWHGKTVGCQKWSMAKAVAEIHTRR